MYQSHLQINWIYHIFDRTNGEYLQPAHCVHLSAHRSRDSHSINIMVAGYKCLVVSNEQIISKELQETEVMTATRHGAKGLEKSVKRLSLEAA